MFNLKQLIKSFQYAMKGLVYVWQNEQNFRIQVGIALVVGVAMAIFDISRGEAIILSMLIIFVLVLEVANSIIEKVVDILKPRIHTYVQVIKDMMAAAVLISSLGATIIALLIFVPHIINAVRYVMNLPG